MIIVHVVYARNFVWNIVFLALLVNIGIILRVLNRQDTFKLILSQRGIVLRRAYFRMQDLTNFYNFILYSLENQKEKTYVKKNYILKFLLNKSKYSQKFRLCSIAVTMSWQSCDYSGGIICIYIYFCILVLKWYP